MTANAPAALICPACGSDKTSLGASGNAMCLDCTHFWNPAEPQPTPPRPVIPLGDAVTTVAGEINAAAVQAASEASGVPAASIEQALEAGDPETYNDVLGALVGGQVTLEGGQVGKVITFTDNEQVVVELGDGRTEVVPFADVERILEPPATLAPAADDDADARMPIPVQVVMYLAHDILRAGINSVSGTGANVTPSVPQSGYLPTDPDMLPLIEQAAAVAVGMILTKYELDVDAMRVELGDDLVIPITGDPTTEADNDASTREVGNGTGSSAGDA